MVRFCEGPRRQLYIGCQRCTTMVLHCLTFLVFKRLPSTLVVTAPNPFHRRWAFSQFQSSSHLSVAIASHSSRRSLVHAQKLISDDLLVHSPVAGPTCGCRDSPVVCSYTSTQLPECRDFDISERHAQSRIDFFGSGLKQNDSGMCRCCGQ